MPTLAGCDLKSRFVVSEAKGLLADAAAAAVALQYYDKTYRFGLENNTSPDIRMLRFEHADFPRIAFECLHQAGILVSGKPVPLTVE